ncbi:thiolase family protein [Arthrobacter sp. AZCC_0090]|uniref:thiolase family protein n=1 Tax=Arthrobacter sp. AZCC_0090 TaxID=2735881 RepID=UPI00161CC773|nr:thiolase family protein [Arthrobacter sp. AZCC_0090]MBB6406340.1 acetyl-CoA acetyltransferase [Arthrobacter sp. AZCC_0090]
MTAAAAISGVGLVVAERDDFSTATTLALRAIDEACADAGIAIGDIDGLLLNHNELLADDKVTLDIGRQGAFGELRLLYELNAKGTTFSVLIDLARQAIAAGRANTVVVLFADAAMRPGVGSGAAFAAMGGSRGQRGLERSGGMLGAVAAYAFLAAHYLQETPATADDLRAVAVAQREWAKGNTFARTRTTLTNDEYLASPFVAEPLRRLDCARPVNGAAAVIVTTADRAGSGRHRAVHIAGAAQRSIERRRHAPVSPWEPVGAAEAFADALGQSGMTAADVNVLQVYDPFTLVPLILLEAFGYAERGGAGDFVRAGQTGPGGSIPTNTGGGQVSSYYLQGVTPVIEAITQLRGTGGARQVIDASVAAIAAVGGRLEHHSTLVLDLEVPR